ncbi:protein Fe65 homolog isoform X2 [Hermetia illucens]|nr:protein Fe65 homolog isoform X2 [Hermetia illucens]
MLSGEILIRAPLSVAILPPPSLIEICRAMAAIATLANSQSIDDDDIFLENGLLSYENPNYHMDPQRIERNSHLYEEILSELHQQQSSLKAVKPHIVNNRKDYARIDIGSMGVDLKENFSASEKHLLFDASPSESKTKSDQTPEKDNTTKLKDTNEAVPIKYISGSLNADDLYALPNKQRCRENTTKDAEVAPEIECEEDDDDEEKCKKEEIEGIEDKDGNKDLPPGWEKHEDNDGPYYWHIKSGTIQREPPTWPKCASKEPKTPTTLPSNQHFAAPNSRSPNNNSFQSFCGARDGLGNRIQETQSLSVTRSNTSSALDQEEDRRRREDLSYKRRSYPLKSESDRPIRFAVRSLGWVEIAEEDLTPERSSKAVNKCIVDLSLGRNDLLDVVGRWGDGKDLFMDLDEGALKLIDPENLTILNTQPIHTIRVWGVGRDNGRDFAYVARDRLTRIHMCHVFRCDTAARTIANTLRDICKRIMIERSLQLDANNTSNSSNSSRNAIRPTDLPTENRKWARHPQSFPTPMEEPKKVLKAQYMGSLEVTFATGIDVLNSAIDNVLTDTKAEDWQNVNVSVAPSMISVYSSGDDGKLLVECRVRYLSFLGIGKNVKNCAFIMHTAQDKFIAHTFHCEPSSGALCKTIEAACKLRYQKCLDAHPENRLSSESSTPSKGLGATIKNFMSSLTLKKDKASS